MKFKLLAPHYLPEGRYVEKDTVIGDGTQFPVNFTDPKAPGYYPVTNEMEGLDVESIAAAEKALDTYVDPILTLPITMDGDKK